jgi:2-C-methyl-D-erythritol 4-phosphate cytidylyltransferase/2-C-methyl-D-erythritol 2,4-cyclodiphosphate synthase
MPANSMPVTTAVIVVAAGSGSRLGRDEPKAFVAVSGRSILERSLDAVFGMAKPVQVIVVVPHSRIELAERVVHATAGSAADHVTVTAGGATRQQSVSAGLALLEPGIQTVLVHDAARALAPAALLETVVDAVESMAVGVVPGIPVADTIKEADASAIVQRTLDRAGLVAVQTPQGFPRDPLVAAYSLATEEFTDDAALFAAAGHSVRVIAGDPLAFKITTAWDLRRAEALLGDGIGTRTGVGVDVHAYDETAPLWLGGLYWPDEPGLAGHSDGDAVCHAICDALLSAAGLGDIGGRFGTSESRFANAHGDVFIGETIALVTGAGFTVGNVAVQVIANHPKLASKRIELEAHLSSLVGAPVSIGATTADGLGFAGRGEGVSVIATALITPHR